MSAYSDSSGGDKVWVCKDLTIAVVPDSTGKCDISIDSIKSKKGDHFCESDGSILK